MHTFKHHIGSQVDDLAAFDNVSDIVVQQVAKVSFEEHVNKAVYVLRAARDNALLFMTYPSQDGAYTITNATNTGTIFFTEDNFCDGQKSAIFSWNRKFQYKIGKVSRLSVTHSVVDFEICTTNNGAYLAPLQYYFIRSKSKKAIAVITAISNAKCLLIQVKDYFPNAVKVLVVAFALHRFHELASEYSNFDINEANDFNGDYQAFPKKNIC